RYRIHVTSSGCELTRRIDPGIELRCGAAVIESGFRALECLTEALDDWSRYLGSVLRQLERDDPCGSVEQHDVADSALGTRERVAQYSCVVLRRAAEKVGELCCRNTEIARAQV